MPSDPSRPVLGKVSTVPMLMYELQYPITTFEFILSMATEIVCVLTHYTAIANLLLNVVPLAIFQGLKIVEFFAVEKKCKP